MEKGTGDFRHNLLQHLQNNMDHPSEILMRLLAIPSENPPGDTTALALEIKSILSASNSIDVRLVCKNQPIENVLAVVKGRSPGRRLVFNGHLDTFQVGDPSQWTRNPYGEQLNGRMYGRGSSDMKGGLAVQIQAMLCLAAWRENWSGELVLALTGDEETAGPDGTQFLLDSCEFANGDAMMCADAGSPQVLRFGEKGVLWLTLMAEGRPGHGAHAHLTISAIDRLLAALVTLSTLRDLTVHANHIVSAAIDQAAEFSEIISGPGETDTLKSVTVNIGTIEGGIVANLVAGHACATVDIRLPAGLMIAELKAHIKDLIGRLPGIRYQIDNETEATITPPDHEIVKMTACNCKEVLGQPVVSTMRVGSSDAALYRKKDIPSVVCGLTPHNMGAADEYVEIEELVALSKIYALTAFDYLTAVNSPPREQ